MRLPIIATVRRSSALATKSATLINADKISDHWKERALPAYAGALFGQTLKLSLLIIVAFAPVVAALLIAPLLDAPLMDLLVSLPGIGLSIAAAGVYAFVRLRFVS